MGPGRRRPCARQQVFEIIRSVWPGPFRKASEDIVFSLESTKFSGDPDARSTQDMTARPPVETRKASSEGSSESPETGDSPHSRDSSGDSSPGSSDESILSG